RAQLMAAPGKGGSDRRAVAFLGAAQTKRQTSRAAILTETRQSIDASLGQSEGFAQGSWRTSRRELERACLRLAAPAFRLEIESAGRSWEPQTRAEGASKPPL